MPNPGARILLAPISALVLLGGCSRSDRPDWPARNYSGAYTVTARVASNDCPTPVFAPGDTLVFALLQSRLNGAQVDIAPVASLVGDFRGDRLEAHAAVSAKPMEAAAPGSAPSAASSRAQASDGTGAPGPADSIRYRLTLDFEGHAFKGIYRVEQPALESGVEACTQVFDVEGTEAPIGARDQTPIRLPMGREESLRVPLGPEGPPASR